MKPISLHVDDKDYRDFKSLAERTGRPVEELIREALTEYLKLRRRGRGSVLDIPPHDSGPQLRSWTREELMDEMIDP
ncbi:MAG TPA: ribbon-helix-helix domain-containing protein [Thermoanaerobaculia bacterium]|nr:ribbon-helix-helix domain-containing protein [Thermoanaerobaculia bacterium]